jgi:hypothetical protein
MVQKTTAWTGWVIFAGILLLVAGSINGLQGLLALIEGDRAVVVRNKLYLVDLTGWGWTTMIFGLLLFAVGIGLLVGQAWARISAIVVVGLYAIGQVFWIGAYPVWSILMITLSTLVLYALTARWSDARDDLRAERI